MTAGKSRPDAGRSPFGELLLKFRTERGLTQERLAAATQEDRISPRSVTNYERAVNTVRDWVLPHRPALQLLSEALALDHVDHHALVVAWSKTRALRDAAVSQENSSPFVVAGREDAIASIMDAWQRAKAGRPQIVFMGGVAGIGKTSIATHVSDRIAASEKEVMVAWGGASSWATSVEPYLAIRTAMDRLLVEPEASSTLPGRYPSRPEPGAVEIDRVIESLPLLGGALISERAVRGVVANHADLDAPTIDSLLSVRSSTETIDRMEEYCQLITHLSRSWPIVMVLEDIHWAGDATARLILHLTNHLQNRRDTPILLICTYRNDEVHADVGGTPHPLAQLLDTVGHSPQVSMVILNNTMSPSAGMAFVRGVLQNTPLATTAQEEELVTWLYKQTSGHPLLTSEMIRHLLQTHALAKKQGDRTWVFDPNKVPAEMPSVMSAFIDQRLKQVSSRARRILEIASVMDDIVLTEIIADVMQEDEENILDVIDRQLVDTHQLLLQGSQVQLPLGAHTSYRFPHALFREHIYGGLRSTHRTRLHLAVAEAMEQKFTQADTATLSEITSHYVLAEDWGKAQIAAYRLALDATDRLDWDLANVWFDQAEALSIRAKDSHQLWRARAARLAVLRRTGQYDTAIELGDRLIELAETHNWLSTLGIARFHLGEIYYDLAQLDRAVEYLTLANELHEREKVMDLVSAGEAMISHTIYRQGKYAAALKHAQRAIEVSRDLQNSWVQSEAILAAANCETDLGFYERAIRNYEVCSELAVMAGKLSNQFIPAMNIGLCNTQLGRYEQAIDDLTALIDRMATLGIAWLSSHASFYLGLAYEGAGMWNEARETYVDTTRIRRTRSGAPVLYDSIAGELRVAVHLGDSERAQTHLTEITDHLDQHGWEGMEDSLLVYMSVAKAHAYFGDDEGYRIYIRQAYALLMERVSLIEDEASVASYLENVPVNIELQTLYATLQNTSAPKP